MSAKQLPLPGFEEKYNLWDDGSTDKTQFTLDVSAPDIQINWEALHRSMANLSTAIRAPIPDMSPNAPISDEEGVLQSKLGHRFDLINPAAIFNLAEILDYGARKYGPTNWYASTVETNLNHALAHIYAYLAGDTQDDHLGHAACRLHFAVAIALGGVPDVISETE